MNAIRPISVVCACIVIGGGVFVLRHNTQSTHQRQPPESTFRVVVESRSNRAEPTQTQAELTEAHVDFCRLEIKSDVIGEIDVVPGAGHVYAFTLQPALDRSDAKQYEGCLEDWVLDSHQMHVISIERGPDRPAGGSG